MPSSFNPEGGGGLGSVALTGTPESGQIIVATSPTEAEWDDETGGAGAAQLPAWTYTSGTIGDGLFTTDNPAIVSTSIINLDVSLLGGGFVGTSIASGTLILFTSASGDVDIYRILSGSGVAGDTTVLTVETVKNPETNWTGVYTVSFLPAKQSATDVGLGSVTDDAQLKIASNLSDLADASTARTNLGLVIGTDVLAPNGNGAGLTGAPALVVTNFTGTLPALNGAAVTDLLAVGHAIESGAANRLLYTDGSLNLALSTLGFNGSVFTASAGADLLAATSYATVLSLDATGNVLITGHNGAGTPGTGSYGFGTDFAPLIGGTLTVQSGDVVISGGGSFTGNGAGLTGLTQAQILAALGITANLAGFRTFLAIFGITPALDGTVTPVTSITTASGIPTNLS